MKRILAITLALAVVGCDETTKAIGTAQSGNQFLAVEKIAVIEDCTVYRFYDEGYARYVTICPNGHTTTTDDERHSSGKSSITVPNAIEAVRKP